MSVGIAWVAGAVRGRLLANRRLGRQGARELAVSPSLEDALQRLERGPYGHEVKAGMNLAQAQRGVGAAALWHLRVLAGWLPPGGGEQARALGGWWEIQNIEDRLALMAGYDPPRPYVLGALATAWPRLSDLDSPAELRDGLVGSSWGDPGGSSPEMIGLGLRLSWAHRVAEEVASAWDWAAGWSLLVVARDLFAGSRLLADGSGRRIPELGRDWRGAVSIPDLRNRVPRSAAWVLDGVDDPEGLWRAEAGWWRRVEGDSLRELRRAPPGSRAVVAVFGALLADSWRVQAALELAARGGARMDVFDAVA